MTHAADVVIIGAGIIGAACAYYCAAEGLRVTVLDRGAVAGGTSGRGEGNLLVSDKEPGPELRLMIRSLELWRALADTEDGRGFELEAKGGLMVAADPEPARQLLRLTAAQRGAGVTVRDVAGGELRSFEPALAPGLAGGAFYPGDMQCQPMLATAHLLKAARQRYGVRFRPGTPVTGLVRSASGRIVAVRTPAADIAAGWVVNAAGTWAGEVAALAGAELPISPRRGFILVTQPLPALIRHKVYAADYLADVASDRSGLASSAVVEGTPAGTILIGASRERAGYDPLISLPVLRRLARQAITLFPALAGVHAIRAYRGFRPYSPDHLPVIGPDPLVPGLVHATGHEGAGIGLAPATGELVAAHVTGAATAIDPIPFAPGRFGAERFGAGRSGAGRPVDAGPAGLVPMPAKLPGDRQ